MDLIIGIVVFIAFSVISDVFEGNKKKNKSIPQSRPPVNSPTETKPVVVPKIKMQQPKTTDFAYGDRKKVAALAAYVKKEKSATMQQAMEKVATVTAEKNQLKPTDIHSDVLLHAVAYAQILQPPKAYQYMATRSCRGDWGNNK